MNERDKELWSKAAETTKNESWDEQVSFMQRFADLIRADEREAIAQMFEDTPALVPFAQNDKGGCMICGFTPKLAMEAIRARGNT
jgi:hypothetical protein